MKINERDISPAAVVLQLLIEKGIVTEEEYYEARRHLAEILSQQLISDLSDLEEKPAVIKTSKILHLSDFLNKKDD